MGIFILNLYGKHFTRRRGIEGGLIGLGLSLIALSIAQPLTTRIGPQISLLSVVIVVAFAAGVSYAFVAVPAQTQLQEELPENIRGRVFGVLNMVNSSPIIPADQKAQISAGLEENAQLLSNTELDALIVNQPADVEAEILRINTEARPIALQIALLVPLIAGLLGFLISLRMVKIPEVKPAAVLEGLYG